MRLVKAFMVGIVGLFVFITLLSLLIPANPEVSRTVVINGAAKDKIYAQVADLKNWKHWHPLFASDSATISYGASTMGINASCDITYKNKTTHLTITKTDTSSIAFTLKADGENDISNRILFSTVATAAQTRVDWIAKTHLHWYPWEKFYAIFIDKLTGPGYEAALNSLRLLIETAH